MRRRIVLLLVVAVAALALAAGAVLAIDRTCTELECVGTRFDDTITGSTNYNRIAAMEGNDVLDGGGGAGDEIYGDEGNDTITDTADDGDNDRIYGDQGNDTIDVREGDDFFDTVNCGPGKKDKVFFDEGIDEIANNCEIKNPS